MLNQHNKAHLIEQVCNVLRAAVTVWLPIIPLSFFILVFSIAIAYCLGRVCIGCYRMAMIDALFCACYAVVCLNIFISFWPNRVRRTHNLICVLCAWLIESAGGAMLLAGVYVLYWFVAPTVVDAWGLHMVRKLYSQTITILAITHCADYYRMNRAYTAVVTLALLIIFLYRYDLYGLYAYT